MRLLLYIAAAAWLLLAAACVRHSGSWATLDRADAVMEERPDSALTLLQGIDASRLIGDEERARYALLMSMALMKEGYVVDDTAFIAGALRHYQNGGDTPEHMKSLYLTADVLHNAGEYGAAMSMLLKAYDIAEGGGDCYWQAKTSELMGDVSSSAYANADLADYSLRAADYYRKAGRDNNRRFVLVDHAIALANMGSVEDALAQIDSIGVLGSVFPADSTLLLYCARAKISILVGNGMTEEALAAMGGLTATDLELIMPAKNYANLAKLFVSRGDLGRAASYLAKADSLKRTPSDTIAVVSAYSDYHNGRNDLVSAKLYSDSLVWMQDRDVRRLLEHSTVAPQRDFIREKERLADEKGREAVVVSVVSVLFLLTVIAALISVYRLRLRAEKAERLGTLKELAAMTDRFVSESERSQRLLESVAQGKSLLHEREEEIAGQAKDIENMSAEMQERLTQNRQLSEELRKLKDAISEKDLILRETDTEIGRLLERIRQLQDSPASTGRGKAEESAPQSRFKDEAIPSMLEEIHTLSEEVRRLRAEYDSLSAKAALAEGGRDNTDALRMEQTRGMSMMRGGEDERERALHREMYELYRGNWITLNLLCRRLSAGTETEIATGLLVEDIERVISELRSEKAVREIEERVNKYNDNMAGKLRAQCAFLKPDDIKFLVFLMAGFSSHGVCAILGLSQSNFYKKRGRLLERIGTSDALDRDSFVSAISGAT